ncbi:MAG TPA: hypothetical protein VEA16_09760 [Vicinamibacterales bacterium]|nr:hypothetical protein [Vicinamibacterales bacterium]
MLSPGRRNRQRRAVAQGASLPAPTGGWDAVNSLSDMPEDRAVVLDNWFPHPDDVVVRRGSQIHATGLGSGVVDSLLVYHGATNASSKMFGCANSRIYDVTSEGGASASVTGLSNNRWQSTNFTLSSGTHYLWACNGADDPRAYNGSSWVTPSISGITASDAINVNVHKNRLWLVLRDSMKAAYLNTDAFQGTATPFNLGSVMGKGGFLVSMGTWTQDAGNGPDDYAVFVSSRGQAAIYQGTDPSSASTWSLVGVFDLGAPIGRRCLTKVAGDLALVNIDGVLPLSKALGVDRGAVAQVAITANINNAMNDAARSYKDNFGWELCPYPKGTMALLNVPLIEGQEQHQYVMNTLTGAWCRFKGMDANCWAVFRDNLYFGGNEGLVWQADTTALDGIEPIDAIGQQAYNYFRSKGQLKRFTAVQPMLTTDSASRPAIGISTDFKDNATLGTPSSSAISAALYDSAVWDTDTYPVESRSITDWTTLSGTGQCASIHFRARTGRETGLSVWGEAQWGVDSWSASTAGEVEVKLNGFNVIYERGGFL